MIITPPSRAIHRLGELLSHHTGQTLSESRRWRIETLLRPLMRARDLPSLDALLAAIDRDRAGLLLAETIDAMLNHESSFFRDIAMFRLIEQDILPRIHAQARERSLRLWCAGCSTGQEAYSLAMMLKRMGTMWDGWRITIQATDVSPIAIETAKRGRYAQLDMQRGLPISDLLRWFTPATGNDWQISDEIRVMVNFQADNLLAPRKVSGQFDLILCRNVLFYFPEQQRQAACDQIGRHTKPGTFLMLGAGEMLPARNGQFLVCRDMGGVYVADRTASRLAV